MKVAIAPFDEVSSEDVATLAARLYPHVSPHPPETRAAIAVQEALEIYDLVLHAMEVAYADEQGDDTRDALGHPL